MSARRIEPIIPNMAQPADALPLPIVPGVASVGVDPTRRCPKSAIADKILDPNDEVEDFAFENSKQLRKSNFISKSVAICRI